MDPKTCYYGVERSAKRLALRARALNLPQQTGVAFTAAASIEDKYVIAPIITAPQVNRALPRALAPTSGGGSILGDLDAKIARSKCAATPAPSPATNGGSHHGSRVAHNAVSVFPLETPVKAECCIRDDISAPDLTRIIDAMNKSVDEMQRRDSSSQMRSIFVDHAVLREIWTSGVGSLCGGLDATVAQINGAVPRALAPTSGGGPSLGDLGATVARTKCAAPPAPSLVTNGGSCHGAKGMAFRNGSRVAHKALNPRVFQL